jgi:hypothetical protein
MQNKHVFADKKNIKTVRIKLYQRNTTSEG